MWDNDFDRMVDEALDRMARTGEVLRDSRCVGGEE